MRTRFLAAPALGLAVLVAACSGGTGATTAPTAAPTAAPTQAPASQAPAAGGGATVNLADTTLGKVLADGDGKTLYIFTPDGTTGKSTCTGDCIKSWPALESDATPTLGDGLDAEDFTSFTREDDSKAQVVFYGMPLYYFAGDQKAGDTNGQGLGGKWYVVGADGKPIK